MNIDKLIGPSKSGRELLQLQENQSHRILVVENDPINCNLTKEVLIWHGYIAKAVGDAAAWGELQAAKYNLLITDYELPTITGIELIKTLRSARKDLPVVLIAGKLPIKDLVQRPSLQPVATLLKPFSVNALLETVKTALAASNTPLGEIAARANTITPVLQELLDYQIRSHRNWR